MKQQGFVQLSHQPVREHSDAVLVTIDGSVDPKTVNQFKSELQAIVSRGAKRLIFDCAKLTYINSSGLAYLLNLVGSLKEVGGMIAMVGAINDIVIIFDMMGITGLFQFYPSTDEVLQEMDEKLARELVDVGPPLPLDESVPEPSPATSTPTPASTRRLRAVPARKPVVSVLPPPPTNLIVRFFRALFGLDDPPPSGTTRRRRKRRG
jgi:anti-sigma B factor antagonist